MKCIVIQTSPERINAEPVTNEDGTPHIYATISEARAELKSNGYSYNSANERYYIKSTEYRAYILRADSEEYAEIIEKAAHEAAAIADEAHDPEVSSTAEMAAEEAYRARQFANDARETAEQNAAEDEPEPDEITQYMRRQAFGDYSHADATTREEMEAAALKFAAQEQTRLVALWQEAGARQARERYEADEATARDLMNLQDAGAITAEDVASYYQRHGWDPRKYHRN